MTGLTNKTLRFYDEKGLLKPTWVDPSARNHPLHRSNHWQ
ncbi:MAG: MerR family DNA-binding transcriptional regulator [bacterium]|nr:MerR family DNA-binding transcriptional regulator [bacterium]